jgi:hypothetical protein
MFTLARNAATIYVAREEHPRIWALEPAADEPRRSPAWSAEQVRRLQGHLAKLPPRSAVRSSPASPNKYGEIGGSRVSVG